jgi:hypothetical protein
VAWIARSSVRRVLGFEFNKQARLASAKRHLRTFTYISYALYPLGIVIGILGQLAGVKAPGGE